MTRAFNFSAGPAALPDVVLARARNELLDWHGRGVSVMEMSHRSAEFESVAAKAEADLRKLLGVPDAYAVLFLQGGATSQFAMVPLNLLPEGGSADYIHTGQWAKKAIDEAKRFGRVNIAASGESSGFNHVPERNEWRLDATAAYVHITTNETIGGVQFRSVPDVAGVPLVADASSDLLSEPLDVSKFGLIYAGAQKNLGPAGITLVIVRRDLVGRARASCPSMLDYAPHVENGSMFNTPPTFSWYLTGLVLEWMIAEGGLVEMAKRNEHKAAKLYAHIDQSNFYTCPVKPACRSRMNVPFTMPDAKFDKPFLADAEARRLQGLKGHRSVGGMRASLYNAVSEAAVDALIELMNDFEQQHG